MLFYIVAVPVYISTNSAGGFLFLHTYSSIYYLYTFFFLLCFLGCTHSIWGKLEGKLLAYTTATAIWDPSHVCNLYHCSWQRQILNPGIEPTTSWFSQIHFFCTTTGTHNCILFYAGHAGHSDQYEVVCLICISLIISEFVNF